MFDGQILDTMSDTRRSNIYMEGRRWYLQLPLNWPHVLTSLSSFGFTLEGFN